MIKDVLFYTLLLDFYGQLLTNKQHAFFEMYYLDDFSLNEIGIQHNITPQAVRDLLKRTEKLLLEYESKLLLVCKHQKQQKELNKIYDELKNFNVSEYDKQRIIELFKSITK